ncbi:unnamed protein product [Nesidiocoris tenuis]|uniref:Uncharacterized protein n=1 Tax=Nesidiocoris tenuis TaxID=355587 RepID=A0A6H5H1L0_9HEMI|nr:unnamed protein product [Nesidiocoris tenuis]
MDLSAGRPLLPFYRPVGAGAFSLIRRSLLRFTPRPQAARVRSGTTKTGETGSDSLFLRPSMPQHQHPASNLARHSRPASYPSPHSVEVSRFDCVEDPRTISGRRSLWNISKMNLKRVPSVQTDTSDMSSMGADQGYFGKLLIGAHCVLLCTSSHDIMGLFQERKFLVQGCEYWSMCWCRVHVFALSFMDERCTSFSIIAVESGPFPKASWFSERSRRDLVQLIFSLEEDSGLTWGDWLLRCERDKRPLMFIHSKNSVSTKFMEWPSSSVDVPAQRTGGNKVNDDTILLTTVDASTSTCEKLTTGVRTYTLLHRPSTASTTSAPSILKPLNRKLAAFQDLKFHFNCGRTRNRCTIENEKCRMHLWIEWRKNFKTWRLLE